MLEMPTTVPSAAASAPPLWPPAMSASVWRKGTSMASQRRRRDRMPRVIAGCGWSSASAG
jgi:hypothetical protein